MRILPWFAAVILSFSGISFAEPENIVINEIMYAPPAELGGAYNEWVEIYNPLSSAVNLSGWAFAETTKNHTLSGNIEPYGFVILARKPENFTQYYSVSVPVLETRFMLNNEGETLFLLDAGGNLIDSVTYLPVENSTGPGRTLERTYAGWLESAEFGGTPGRNNSGLFVSEAAPAQNESVAEPEANETSMPEVNIPSNEPETPAQLGIVSVPSPMKFGDYSSMQARLYSGSHAAMGEAKVVAYVFSPHWISRDISRDEEVLRNSPYMSSAAATIQSMQANSTAEIILPVFLKCNRDKKYPEGDYSLRVRLYSYEGGWQPVLEKDTTIHIAGENAICASEVVYVNVTKKCPECPGENTRHAAEPDAAPDILAGFPEEAFLYENFTANITIRNPGATEGYVEIYSYIHDHEKLLSQGFDGSKWRSTWAANAKKIYLNKNETVGVTIQIMPRNTVSPGIYTYKVVMQGLNYSGVMREAAGIIRLKEKPQQNISIEEEDINTTEDAPSPENRITGREISYSKKPSALGRLWLWMRTVFGR